MNGRFEIYFGNRLGCLFSEPERLLDGAPVSVPCSGGPSASIELALGSTIPSFFTGGQGNGRIVFRDVRYTSEYGESVRSLSSEGSR